VVLGLAQVGEALAQSAGNQIDSKRRRRCGDPGVKQEILAAPVWAIAHPFLRVHPEARVIPVGCAFPYGKLRLGKMNAR